MQEQLLRAHPFEGTIEESSQDKKEDCDDTKQHHDPTGERRSVGGRRRGRRWTRRTGQRAVRGLYEGAGFVFGRCGEAGPEDFVSCWPRIGVAMVATVPQ